MQDHEQRTDEPKDAKKLLVRFRVRKPRNARPINIRRMEELDALDRVRANVTGLLQNRPTRTFRNEAASATRTSSVDTSMNHYDREKKDLATPPGCARPDNQPHQDVRGEVDGRISIGAEE